MDNHEKAIVQQIEKRRNAQLKQPNAHLSIGGCLPLLTTRVKTSAAPSAQNNKPAAGGT
jgi:hypothetical protein